MKFEDLNKVFEQKYGFTSLNEDLKYQKEIKDDKTGDTVTISGDNENDLNNKVRKFKYSHGGEKRFKDIATQRQNGNTIQDRKEIMNDVEESLDEDMGIEVNPSQAWEIFDKVQEAISAEELCYWLKHSFSSEDLADALGYICRKNNLNPEELLAKVSEEK